ncbi:MAG: hypothetical protein NT917_11370, partial [Microcystis aeruginosa WS75]|nr:hypothetical protein [Microcystis aeruginosa WS75]
LPSMCMVRSPKSIGGIFGLALGNAPYGDCDRTEASLCFQNRDFIVFMEKKEFFSDQKPLSRWLHR